VKSSTKSLMRLSVKKLKKLLALKKRMEKAAPLIEKRMAILERVAEIDKMLSGSASGRRVGRPRGRKPGRPPKAVRRGRPAKKARKMSAAARKRNALAVSKAQKARWAAYRKAKAAKTKARSKVVRKPSKKAPQAAPKPGTLSAKILKVAGPESEQA
jgi:hypothetical protein